MTRSRHVLIVVLQRTSGVTVAARLRVRPSTVTRWVNGECVPNAIHAKKLEMIYGVPSAQWCRSHVVTERELAQRAAHEAMRHPSSPGQNAKYRQK